MGPDELAAATRFWIEDLIAVVKRTSASDLHLKVGAAPIIRLHGQLAPLDGYAALEKADTVGLLHQMLQDPARLERLHRTGAVDFAYESKHDMRLRVNAFHESGVVAIACRPIPIFIQSFDDLNLPPVLEEVADAERGLILVTGTTGSGKSTT